MGIGYACLAVGVLNTKEKSCMLKNASPEKLLELTSYNLNSLENVIDYNIENDIKLFRISSNIIPFGSSPINKFKWWEIFKEKFQSIGEKIQKSGMRVSTHPGQYTVINSPKEEVVKKAIEDLNYHTQVLDSLRVGEDHKIVLHIGGIYDDKNQAIERFIENYKKLDDKVKKRIVIENDDKSYNINDVLEIGHVLNIPVIFDNLHNRINPPDEEKDEYYWIDECRKTWKKKDGCQKIHYSQQDPLKKPGSHSKTIGIRQFMSFYEGLETKDIDIMLEVKDKNISAIKCINCTSSDKSTKNLEIEWSRYKYKILENAPSNYVEIRKLLKDKDNYPVMDFYDLVEDSMEKKSTKGNSINAALHLWGYFKEVATDKEKNYFFNSIEKYNRGGTSIATVKNSLWRMAVKYNEFYLLNSYYFIEE